MVILIWIQAGFAMVILSAAIKGIPTEIVEAARLDGVTRCRCSATSRCRASGRRSLVVLSTITSAR